VDYERSEMLLSRQHQAQRGLAPHLTRF